MIGKGYWLQGMGILHSGTTFSIHDGPLIGDDWLNKDGIQNANEETCGVQATQHVEDGL